MYHDKKEENKIWFFPLFDINYQTTTFDWFHLFGIGACVCYSEIPIICQSKNKMFYNKVLR